MHFFHEYLKEDLYICLLHGVSAIAIGDATKVCHSLYGLKQAPQEWFEKLQNALIHLEFHQSPYDPSMFLRLTPQGLLFYLFMLTTPPLLAPMC